MHEPIKDFDFGYYPAGDVTQFFGWNPELYAKSTTGLKKGHNGLDIVAPHGTPIYAVEEGKVVRTKRDEGGYGKHIRIINPSQKHEWIYGHLYEILVKEGDMVEAGMQIATMGNTGFVVSSTPYWEDNPYAGTHLHLGLRGYKAYKPADKTWNISYPTGDKGTILDYDNGYFGSVNWLPLWLDTIGLGSNSEPPEGSPQDYSKDAEKFDRFDRLIKAIWTWIKKFFTKKK